MLPPRFLGGVGGSPHLTQKKQLCPPRAHPAAPEHTMAPGALLACMCAWSVLFTHARAVAPGQRTRLGLAQARSAGVARHEAGNSQCRYARIERDCDLDACPAAPPGRRYVVLSSDTGDMKYVMVAVWVWSMWVTKRATTSTTCACASGCTRFGSRGGCSKCDDKEGRKNKDRHGGRHKPQPQADRPGGHAHKHRHRDPARRRAAPRPRRPARAPCCRGCRPSSRRSRPSRNPCGAL